MKITRIINNNTIATIANKKEIILMGSGIGFQKKPGDAVEVNRIEKVYQIRDRFFQKYEQIFRHIEPMVFKLVEQIQKYAEDALQCTLSPQFIFALADHISYAVERQKNQEPMPNLMLQEIKLLYHKEYQIGKYGKQLVEQEMHVALPEDEAGYFALHIVNSRTGEASVDVNNILVLTNGILKILEEELGICCREDDFEYSRFLTHLKFLARRIFNQEQVQFGIMEGLYLELLAREPKLEEIIEKIKNFISETFDYDISEEESAYLAMHILRIRGQ